MHRLANLYLSLGCEAANTIAKTREHGPEVGFEEIIHRSPYGPFGGSGSRHFAVESVFSLTEGLFLQAFRPQNCDCGSTAKVGVVLGVSSLN
jgi:hypothetical protein